VRQGDRWLVDGAVVNPVPVSVSRAMGVDVVIAVDLYGYHSGRIQVLPVSMTSQKNVEAEMDMSARQETGFMDLFARGRDYVSNLTDKFSLGTKSNPGMIAVMSQSMGILEQRHKRARLMGDPPDICIVPEVGNIGTMEFHRADEAIAAGEAAVEKVAHLIEAALWKG